MCTVHPCATHKQALVICKSYLRYGSVCTVYNAGNLCLLNVRLNLVQSWLAKLAIRVT